MIRYNIDKNIYSALTTDVTFSVIYHCYSV